MLNRQEIANNAANSDDVISPNVIAHLQLDSERKRAKETNRPTPFLLFTAITAVCLSYNHLKIQKRKLSRVLLTFTSVKTNPERWAQ